MIGSTLKQHVFTGGDPSPFTLYVPTMISVYCDSGYLGQTLWGVGTYTVAGLYPGCFQVVLGYTISGSFYAGLSPTYFRCMPCPPGSYSVSGSSACTPCPVGTSQPGTGSTACIACDEGYVASSPGTAACVTCDGGYYEPGNRSLCVPCLPGAYASAGSTVCQDCPENTFSSGGRETCAPCPYFSVSLGGGDISGCLCSAGYLRQLVPFFLCYPCAAGTYSGINSTTCLPCGAGTYSPLAASGCVQCVTGTYQPNQGSDRCLPCQAGTLSDPGSQVCQACPAPLYCEGGGRYAACPLGTYSVGTGLRDAADCPVCPANRFCQTSGEIEACPPHTSSFTGSVSKLNCRCNPGFTCTYTKAVRVNITLPLTQAQFELVRGQFLQAVADAAGVLVSQVTVLGLSLLTPPNATRRRLFGTHLITKEAREILAEAHVITAEVHGITVEAHVQGAEQLGSHGIREHMMRHGIHIHDTCVRHVHSVHTQKARTLIQWALSHFPGVFKSEE